MHKVQALMRRLLRRLDKHCLSRPHCMNPFSHQAEIESNDLTEVVDIVYIFTHICLVDPSILINWTSPFPILGVAGVLFHFILFLIEIPVSKQWTLIRRRVEKTPVHVGWGISWHPGDRSFGMLVLNDTQRVEWCEDMFYGLYFLREKKNEKKNFSDK